jgi:S1-C subfamily serine protease
MAEPTVTVTRSELWKARLRRLVAGLRKAAPFAAGVFAAFTAILLYNQVFPPPLPLTTKDVNEAIAQAMASATPAPAFSEQVYQIIRPSLVLIQTKSPGKDGKTENGLGSGFIIDESGDIMTSLHVVTDTTSIQVTFADGTQSSAQITTQQPEIDIALLKTDNLPAQVVPAVLGNPNAMRVGDEAYVVGNPFGLYGSMSAGVISGFDRSFQPPGAAQNLQGLIQIDTAVNPGNSGGPLLNRYGQVIGVVEGIVNPTGQDVFIGIGFAVPIDTAGGAMGSPID